jgi:glycosyltransferase involved in cell wall biosynthesis
MKKKLVSILIPCYNSREYLAETIESALNQTWPNCEIIIVDDGSNDDSLEIAREYEGDDVHVIAQSNQGAPAARNRAFRASTGDYIQYLDADDLLHPRKIEAQMSALRKYPPKTPAVCSTVYLQDGEAPQGGPISPALVPSSHVGGRLNRH